MNYEEILNNRYCAPAAVLSYRDGQLKILGINDRFLSEHWMNTAKDVFLGTDITEMFDENNMRIFTNAIKRCVNTGDE